MAIQIVSAFLFLLIPSLLQKEAPVAPATPRFLLQDFLLGMRLPLQRTFACC
jgi:hypothetical protein